MDRSSRFQNLIPLSNGGFNKTPPIQNDGIGMKPLPPMILDRFRAMVKEREEELKVFGGAAVLPLSTDEIVRLYEIVLSELTINSKPIITDLTIIAGEQRAHGEGIAGAICARIIEVPVDLKLPALYLLDSIVKNIGKEYIKFFSALLPEIFCEAYAQAYPNMHQAMRHLFGTWSAVFPLSVLKMIEAQLQFSPSVNVQSGLTSSRASESPRPTHGIHINPKYLEAEQQFGHSTGDPLGTEGVSSTGRAGLATSGHDAANKPQLSTARTTSSSSPYGLGSTGPLSPSLEERVAVRASPSRFGTDYGLSKVMGREEETSKLKKRNWQGNSKPQSKASIPCKYSNTSGLDLRGPRALISAYGIDEREKHLNRKPLTAEEMDLNGAEQPVAIRKWQNTEEEEFDWDGMTPSLADHKQSNDIYPSLPPHANFSARHSFTTNQAARLPIHGLNNKISGMLPNFTGCSDLTSHVPHFAQESLIMPRQQPQSHFNAKGGGLLVESRKFLTVGDQKPPFISNLSNIDGKVGGHPANFQNSHMLSSSTFSSHIPIRGQFSMNSAGNMAANQIHLDASSTRSMPLVTFPQISGIRPGLVSVNMQRTAQPSLIQPNLLIAQEARSNLSLPFSAPITSHTMVPRPNYGYRAQGRGGHNGPTPSNLVAGVQSLFPIPNIPNMPFHGASSIGQNTDQVAPSAPIGNGFSGLISSLMAQGLISLTKQDSVGVELDPESLKVRHVGVINSLYTDLPRQCTTCGLRFKGQEEHRKHMDWHVSKNRTLKNRKMMPSPKWFVSIHMWLSGSEALGAEAVPGFLPTEKNVEEEEEDEELAVPADEDQNACALCGEPFDDFYSDETEEWMYRGAIYMYAPDGGTVGMDRSQLGPIVHAKCMSNSHEVPSDDLRKSETELTEEGNQRKRLRS